MKDQDNITLFIETITDMVKLAPNYASPDFVRGMQFIINMAQTFLLEEIQS